MIDLEQVGKATDCRDGSRKHPFAAVEKMLCRVVGTIPDKRFGVDHEPWCALRLQNIARMSIGCKQHIVG